MAKGSSKSNAIVDKAKTKEVKAKSVTNLKITRNGSKFTATWKNPVKFSSIKISYRLKVKGKWTKWKAYTAISKTATSKVFVTIDWDDYYPNKSKPELHAIAVRVATDQATKTETIYEKKKGKWHKHTLTTKYKYNVEAKSFDVKRPSKPSLSATDGTGSTTFNWSVPNTDKQDDNVFIRVDYQTAVVQDWGAGNPANYKGWSTDTTNKKASGSFTRAFGSRSVTESDSYTVMARCLASGPEGKTSYVYQKVVYAWPEAAKNLKLKSLADKGSTQYRVTLNWDKVVSGKRPAGQYKVQYFIGAPANASLDIPSTASWKDGTDYTLQQPATTQSVAFDTDTKLQDEECMWVRVIQKHVQNLETPCNAVRIKEFSKIKAPTIKSVSYDATSKALSIDVDNNSSFSNATITVKISSWSNSRTGSGTISAASCNLGTKEVTIEAWASFGSKSSDNVSIKYDPTLSASNPTPFAPTNVKAAKSSETLGTVTVSWAAVLKGVTSSKITVADNPNEWDLANPNFIQEVTVSGSGTSGNVGNLEFGTTYYFKVQSINANGTTDYSEDYASITLKATDAPIPRLKAAETSDHDIKVTWNWNTWTSAKQIQLTWSTNRNDGDSDQLAVTTISKRGSGAQSYTIPLEKLERGKRWYIWARFVSDKAISNPGEAQVMMNITPVAPTNLSFVRAAQTTDEAGKTTARLNWRDTWVDTEKTELSWSIDPNAWAKTSGPTKHEFSGRGSSMLIPDLDLGKRWYARVKVSYNDKFYAQTSSSVMLDLRTKPSTPVITLSETVVSQTGGKIDVSWTYSNEDLSPQTMARVTIYNSNKTEIKHLSVPSADSAVTIFMETLGLTGDKFYYVTVRTTSANGIMSNVSAMASFNVIRKPIASITQTSLIDEIIDEGTEDERTIHKLTDLPLNLTVSGASVNGSVLVYVERSRPVFLARPDDSTAYGYEGELVAVMEGDGSGAVSIAQTDLHVDLTDGGDYRITAIVTNRLGVKSDPVTLDFTVKWTHQALIPLATYVTDTDNLIAKITAIAPEGTLATDTFDLYRLSSDAPEIILRGGQWGTTYVDPYPAFGANMGHRIVFRTENGDYTTADNELAWLDCIPPFDGTEQPRLTNDLVVIDFANEQVSIAYNLDVSHSWDKDFTETKYLGGAVQGDWNAAVSRKGSVNGTMVRLTNDSDILKMRRLAAWPGICHVRTPDGSSFAADVQVSEDSSHGTAGKIVDFSLDITRVDSEVYEAMTLADWEAENGLE